MPGYTFRLTDEGKRLYPIADVKKQFYDTPESPELEPKAMPDLNVILYGPPPSAISSESTGIGLAPSSECQRWFWIHGLCLNFTLGTP